MVTPYYTNTARRWISSAFPMRGKLADGEFRGTAIAVDEV